MQNGKDWETIGRMRHLMGALNIERPGSQNHRFILKFAEQFMQQFGYALWATTQCRGRCRRYRIAGFEADSALQRFQQAERNRRRHGR